jgi:hypothetical protein
MRFHPILKEGPVIKLIFGCIVFSLAMYTIIILSQTSSFYPQDRDYIGTFTTASENTSYFMGIQPIMGTDSLKVILTQQQGWENQSRALIKIPQEAENISFLIMPKQTGIIIPEKIAEDSQVIRVPYQVHENLSLAIEKRGILVIRPDLIDNYYGVEFFLPTQMSHPSPSQVSISIPLYSAGESISTGLHQVSRYQVQIYLPKNYELISSVPSPTRFKVIGDTRAIYQFDVNATATDLLINLENRFITRDIRNIQILLGTLIGFSTSLIISQIIDIVSRKDEVINKHRKGRRKEEDEDENLDEGINGPEI